MSIEGGDFSCSITNEVISKTDIDAWNKHCQEHEDYHTMSGTTVCQDCGAELRYRKYPFIPFYRDDTGTHLKRGVQLFCDKHGGEKLNPRDVEVEPIGDRTVELKDTQKTT
jgi:hypothetical protein